MSEKRENHGKGEIHRGEISEDVLSRRGELCGPVAEKSARALDDFAAHLEAGSDIDDIFSDLDGDGASSDDKVVTPPASAPASAPVTEDVPGLDDDLDRISSSEDDTEEDAPWVVLPGDDGEEDEPMGRDWDAIPDTEDGKTEAFQSDEGLLPDSADDDDDDDWTGMSRPPAPPGFESMTTSGSARFDEVDEEESDRHTELSKRVLAMEDMQSLGSDEVEDFPEEEWGADTARAPDDDVDSEDLAKDESKTPPADRPMLLKTPARTPHETSSIFDFSGDADRDDTANAGEPPSEDPAGEGEGSGDAPETRKGSSKKIFAVAAVFVTLAAVSGLVSTGVLDVSSDSGSASLADAGDQGGFQTPPPSGDGASMPAGGEPEGGDFAAAPVAGGEDFADLATDSGEDYPFAPDPFASEGPSQGSRIMEMAAGLENADDDSLDSLFLQDEPEEAPEIDLSSYATAEDLNALQARLSEMVEMNEAQATRLDNQSERLDAATSRAEAAEDRAQSAEEMALAQNEVLVRVAHLQEKMVTAEELIVDLSGRIADMEEIEPADRVSVDRRINAIGDRIENMARDIGLLARYTSSDAPAPSRSPATTPSSSVDVFSSAGGDTTTSVGPSNVPSDVAQGDFVQGYGTVLDVMPVSDGGRLVVMENGSVMID